MNKRAQATAVLQATFDARPDAVRYTFAPYRICRAEIHIDYQSSHELKPTTGTAMVLGCCRRQRPTSGMHHATGHSVHEIFLGC